MTFQTLQVNELERTLHETLQTGFTHPGRDTGDGRVFSIRPVRPIHPRRPWAARTEK
jgi:hypothetical protein